MRREDLERIAKAAEAFGLEHRRAAGMDMLIRPEQPARRAVHLVFAGEDSVPPLGPVTVLRGFPLVRLEELISMDLKTFRLDEQVDLSTSAMLV